MPRQVRSEPTVGWGVVAHSRVDDQVFGVDLLDASLDWKLFLAETGNAVQGEVLIFDTKQAAPNQCVVLQRSNLPLNTTGRSKLCFFQETAQFSENLKVGFPANKLRGICEMGARVRGLARILGGLTLCCSQTE